MEEIERQITNLFSFPPGSPEQKQANEYILQVQQSPQAWEISLQLINHSPNIQSQLFGAQTLLLKTHEEWSKLSAEQRRDVPRTILTILQNYLLQHKNERMGGLVAERIARVYAACCVRTFPVGYKTFQPDLWSLLEKDREDLNTILGILDVVRFYPDELDNIHLNSQHRIMSEEKFLEEMSKPTFALWRECIERGEREIERGGKDLLVKSFFCISTWVEKLPLKRDFLAVLFDLIDHAVCLLASDDDLACEAASEFLLVYFSELPASDQSTFQNVLAKISPLFNGCQQAKEEEDEEKWHLYIRIFVRIGCQFSPLFLSSSLDTLSPHAGPLLRLILDASVSNSLNVSSTGLDFWRSFGRAVESTNLSSNSPPSQYFGTLLPSLLQKCTFPESFEPSDGGVALLVGGRYQDNSDFDYSEFELYRSGVKDIFRFCAQFCTLDLFFSTLHSFLSSSSSSSPDWRKLESVIFASNAIIKTILSRSLSPSSHSFSFSSASSLGGGTPSASPLPLPRQFISILSLSLSSPLFPLLTATVLQFVGEFGALFSGQFDIEQEIALNCVKVLFDGMQVPALISRACCSFKKLTSHAAKYLLPHSQVIFQHIFSSELKHLSSLPNAKVDLFDGVVELLNKSPPQYVTEALQAMVPAFQETFVHLAERSNCLREKVPNTQMAELQLAMKQEEVETAVVGEFNVLKSVFNATDGFPENVLHPLPGVVHSLWPILKEVAGRWRGSEEVTEAFSSLSSTIVSHSPLLLPPSSLPENVSSPPSLSSSTLSPAIVSEMLNIMSSCFEEQYFPCCLKAISSILKDGVLYLRKRRAKESDAEKINEQELSAIRQWRSLSEITSRLALSYLEVCGGLEGEIDMIKAIYDFLDNGITITNGEAFPYQILGSVFALAAQTLPFSSRECFRSIVSMIQSLLNLRAREKNQAPGIPDSHTQLLFAHLDNCLLSEDGDGGFAKCLFMVLPLSFQVNATRRVGNLLFTLLKSYPENLEKWIFCGLNIFDDLLFHEFGKQRTANAILNSLQHQRKFVALITDLARVLNEEADASVLLAFE